MTARFIVADVFEGLATLDDDSVDVVITSPPFLALRSYLPADHPDKSKEIGSESTPAEFIDTLLAVTAELRRVLAPHGSICVELGDTYAGTGGAGGDWSDSEFTTKARVNGGSDGGPTRRITKDGWPLAKSRALIPQLYEIALAYGINPLTGQPSPAGQWRIRNVITWARPNPPVGALGDKWRPATSDLIVACTSSKRYWDDLATRKPMSPETPRGITRAEGTKHDRGNFGTMLEVTGAHPAGAPLLDYWEIPPGGYPGSHYATFPPELVVPCVKAMCPEKVCRVCGEPTRRIVEKTPEYAAFRAAKTGVELTDARKAYHLAEKGGAGSLDHRDDAGARGELHQTTGWTDCGHDDYRPGIVLDPFAGSGTTLAVATGHGHDAIGIDIDSRNADLAMERVGPFLMEIA